MATAHDVAAYILNKQGEMTAMKLQKLLYYSQAWQLVWEDRPLYRERIEAWANGPVVREVYNRHRGQFTVRTWSAGDPAKLDQAERETVDVVLKFYGDKTAHWLSELTHAEPPWKNARQGLGPGDRGERQITTAAMAEYYGALDAAVGT
jgi:uncharacterized phage-associated protein